MTSLSHGHERGTWRYVLETRWSPTDAALAYYLSRSSANDELRAHYQKVRVAQKLLGVVEASFFRLLALQDALPMAERLAALKYFDAADELASVRKALGGTGEVLHVAKQRTAMDDLDRVALMEATANNLMYQVEFTRATGEANATLAELNGEMGINYFEPPCR